jgi:hypothetical protein
MLILPLRALAIIDDLFQSNNQIEFKLVQITMGHQFLNGLLKNPDSFLEPVYGCDFFTIVLEHGKSLLLVL